jgi:hypothetical protein
MGELRKDAFIICHECAIKGERVKEELRIMEGKG